MTASVNTRSDLSIRVPVLSGVPLNIAAAGALGAGAGAVGGLLAKASAVKIAEEARAAGGVAKAAVAKSISPVGLSLRAGIGVAAAWGVYEAARRVPIASDPWIGILECTALGMGVGAAGVLAPAAALTIPRGSRTQILTTIAGASCVAGLGGMAGMIRGFMHAGADADAGKRG